MNLLQRAKALRDKHPSKFKHWQDAVKAAANPAMLKAAKLQKMRNNAVSQKVRSIQSVGAVKKKQTGTSNREIDKRIQAMPVGKRKAGPGAQRDSYYENRANRSDKGKLLGVGAINRDLKSKYNSCLDLIAETKGDIAMLTEKYKNSKPKNKVIADKLKKKKVELADLQKTKLKLSKFK